MKSRLYVGQVVHARLRPVGHVFRYPMVFGAFDLDELATLNREVRWFGHNRRNLMALFDGDYLTPENVPIRAKLASILHDRLPGCSLARVELLTTPRTVHRVFNPVSFYYCRDASDRLECVVAEVNNTFGERHVYALPADAAAGESVVLSAPKAFHVSPFLDRAGEYTFGFGPLGPEALVRVALRREDRPVLRTLLTGRAIELTATNIAKTVLVRPWQFAATMPRILAQAGRLYYQKGLAVHSKPSPSHPDTICRSNPTVRQRIAVSLVDRFLRRLERGHLRLRLPNGSVQSYGDRSAPATVELTVHEYAAFERMARFGDIGFGESYTDGQWDCDDLAALIGLFIDNMANANDARLASTSIGRFANAIRHRLRRNSRRNSRKNIQAHYDLGNDFYRTFLDDRLIYSSAVFARPGDTLEAAQANKLDGILAQLQISEGDHLLEIGCGWGALAIEAAKRHRCRVTGITLSVRQLEWARQRAVEAGVADRVRFELCDYRDLRGRFDRIVSIEMLEAVGHAYFGEFFATCDRLLEPGGRVVLQSITIPDQRYEAYRKSSDWVNKHIFPGGHLPSLTALTAACTARSRLVFERIENIGPHYATTLQHWRCRFEAAIDRLGPMGFDSDFVRKWRYYFCYCDAGFTARALNNLQIVLVRPCERQ